MSFCSLIKGIAPKICMLCFVPNKQHSFEHFTCLELVLECWQSFLFESIVLCNKNKHSFPPFVCYDLISKCWQSAPFQTSFFLSFFTMFKHLSHTHRECYFGPTEWITLIWNSSFNTTLIFIQKRMGKKSCIYC